MKLGVDRKVPYSGATGCFCLVDTDRCSKPPLRIGETMTGDVFHWLDVMETPSDFDRTGAVNSGVIHRVTTAPSGVPVHVSDDAFEPMEVVITNP